MFLLPLTQTVGNSNKIVCSMLKIQDTVSFAELLNKRFNCCTRLKNCKTYFEVIVVANLWNLIAVYFCTLEVIIIYLLDLTFKKQYLTFYN